MTAQAAARRAQNVMGAMACLAGGAQLHSRENLEAVGGQVDTSTLAEDTYTTFLTQLGGRRVVFEPAAVVLAEEPDTVTALWKQRVRWARGNVQITRDVPARLVPAVPRRTTWATSTSASSGSRSTCCPSRWRSRPWAWSACTSSPR